MSCRNGEAHSALEDDRQEIREGVSNGGAAHENQREGPDFEVQPCAEKLANGKGLGDGIPAVFVDAINDVASFALAEEAEGLVLVVREADDGPIADYGDDASYL